MPFSTARVVRVQNFENGIRIEVREDGSRIQVNPGGRTIETLADNTKIQVDPDGGMITRHPDGSTTQINPDQVVIEVCKDGNINQMNLDGTCVARNKDGTTIFYDDNGDERFRKMKEGHSSLLEVFSVMGKPEECSGQVKIYNDGTREWFKPDGNKMKKRPDGSTEELFPDGKLIETFSHPIASNTTLNRGMFSKIKERPTKVDAFASPNDVVRVVSHVDGTTEKTFADGIQQIIKRDGCTLQTMPDGTTIEIKTDGTRIQINADGRKIESFPDGSRVQTDKEGGKSFGGSNGERARTYLTHRILASPASKQQNGIPAIRSVVDLDTRGPHELREIAHDLGVVCDACGSTSSLRRKVQVELHGREHRGNALSNQLKGSQNLVASRDREVDTPFDARFANIWTTDERKKDGIAWEMLGMADKKEQVRCTDADQSKASKVQITRNDPKSEVAEKTPTCDRAKENVSRKFQKEGDPCMTFNQKAHVIGKKTKTQEGKRVRAEEAQVIGEDEEKVWKAEKERQLVAKKLDSKQRREKLEAQKKLSDDAKAKEAMERQERVEREAEEEDQRAKDMEKQQLQQAAQEERKRLVKQAVPEREEERTDKEDEESTMEARQKSETKKEKTTVKKIKEKSLPHTTVEDLFPPNEIKDQCDDNSRQGSKRMQVRVLSQPRLHQTKVPSIQSIRNMFKAPSLSSLKFGGNSEITSLEKRFDQGDANDTDSDGEIAEPMFVYPQSSFKMLPKKKNDEKATISTRPKSVIVTDSLSIPMPTRQSPLPGFEILHQKYTPPSLSATPQRCSRASLKESAASPHKKKSVTWAAGVAA